jgi:hypothetical protein
MEIVEEEPDEGTETASSQESQPTLRKALPPSSPAGCGGTISTLENRVLDLEQQIKAHAICFEWLGQHFATVEQVAAIGVRFDDKLAQVVGAVSELAGSTSDTIGKLLRKVLSMEMKAVTTLSLATDTRKRLASAMVDQILLVQASSVQQQALLSSFVARLTTLLSCYNNASTLIGRSLLVRASRAARAWQG